MQLVVNRLISEHDLIDQISIPYIVETKAVVNTTPTDRKNGERMRHYKEPVNSYYLDTSASKDSKEAQLAELAGECGLGVIFGEAWQRR